MQFETIVVERPDPRIARIVMNRPEARNAQNLQMTYDLNTAFDQAVQDEAVKIIILAGNGPHFSAGHDLRPGGKNAAGVDFPPVGNWGGFAEPNAHGRFAREQEIYLQITRRWRNLAKPTIAEVHGKCIAGGLMLAWACDLIVASSDAEFCDPVVTMGVCGVEWFVHPWELGPRKAKELLFTADVWRAQDEQRLLRESVDRFIAETYDADHRRRLASDPLGFSPEIWKQFAALGWLALPIEEAYGGLGGGAVETGILMEAFGRGLVAEPYLATVVIGAT